MPFVGFDLLWLKMLYRVYLVIRLILLVNSILLSNVIIGRDHKVVTCTSSDFEYQKLIYTMQNKFSNCFCMCQIHHIRLSLSLNCITIQVPITRE